MDTKQKYIRLKEYNEIIIFSHLISHDTFKYLSPISAGFCYVDQDKVSCFGNSISLGLTSQEQDTTIATKQLFGYDAMLKLDQEK